MRNCFQCKIARRFSKPTIPNQPAFFNAASNGEGDRERVRFLSPPSRSLSEICHFKLGWMLGLRSEKDWGTE